ncbi:MAG: sugar transferase, partial [Spirochaetota bacterium]|nr:sugar transferase [Spirochaetota bacterium]
MFTNFARQRTVSATAEGGLSNMSYQTAKRLFDITFSLLGLVIFAPFLFIIAIIIKLEDAGTVFFRQARMGKRNISFSILKFRTMRHEKVTRIGRWLRGNGIDEIPQFLNVLKGDMSMVGPRPLTEDDIRRLSWNTPVHKHRWDVRPGITGLTQLLSGHSARYSRRVDKLYARKKSIKLDFV